MRTTRVGEAGEFDWGLTIGQSYERIIDALKEFRPESQYFRDQLWNELAILVEIVEKGIQDTYREQHSRAVQESTRENMQLISRLLTGEIRLPE